MDTITPPGRKSKAIGIADLEPADRAAFESRFVSNMVRLVRAHDTFGSRDDRGDPAVIGQFVVTREQRRTLPIIADPDAATVKRVRIYYSALALTIEQDSGVMATPMLDLSSEGFGRVVIIAGRLVVLDRQLRDIHRFGFESFNRLASDGEALVNQAVTAIRHHRDIAGG